MIIQVKSSYSGGLTYNLEEIHELYISHTSETHAYVQKTADANAVARLYLLNGELHLAPVSRSGKIFLQNRPFTEETVVGRETLLQVKENVLLFQKDGEVVILMMGLVLGYGSTSSGKSVKVTDLTPTTPSRVETTEPSMGRLLIRPTIQPDKEEADKTHEDEKTQDHEAVSLSRFHEMSEADILLLSESSTTTLSEIQKNLPSPVVAKSNKGKWAAIAACIMIVLCAMAWYIFMKNPVVPQERVQPIAQREQLQSPERKTIDSKSLGSSGVSSQTEVGTKKSNIENEAGTSNDTIESRTVTLLGGVELKLVKVEKGSFLMGSEDGNGYEKPVHRVTLTKDFWMGRYEVTQAQYEAVMGKNPSEFKTEKGDCPVESVSWHDAMTFCRKLTECEKAAGRLPVGYEYTLPTEAQWEFAARGGSESKGYEYSGGNDIETVAWYEYHGNSDGKTHPVGTKQANELGLHDMSGNVWEWCRDWHGGYPPGEVMDPTGPATGSLCVRRGGSWGDSDRFCRLSFRFCSVPTFRSNNLGFRVALVSIDSFSSDSSGTSSRTEAGTKKSDIENENRTANDTIESMTVALPGGVELKLVKIPAGNFRMGRLENGVEQYSDEKQHSVTLTNDYWLGETEVTQKQYEAVKESNPSNFKHGGDYPVESVAWYDAMSFCKTLTALEREAGRLPEGYEYSLPTAAQWEYACRAGTTTDLNNGKNLTQEQYNCTNLDEVGWYTSNSGGCTHPVRQKKPNAWGLYDMHGNVWEWCRDRMNNENYPDTAMNGYRVSCGGSWNGRAGACRSSSRLGRYQHTHSRYLGFRIALVTVDSTASSSDNVNKTEAGTKTVEKKMIASTSNEKIEYKTITLPNDVEMKLVKIIAGSFMMGSPENEMGGGNKKQHRVTLTKDYWLGETEVTQKQYKAIMETNPSNFKHGGDYPVESVSWYDAMAFCQKLTELERKAGRLPADYEYSLPTEAQWEYACRAGTTTAFNNGKNPTHEFNCANLDEVGWYMSNSGGFTHPVGQKNPNAWGLYDMHGNVWEWCRDWYESYPDGEVTDPTGPATGSSRVNRGGAWKSSVISCSSSSRGGLYTPPSFYFDGFRVALVPIDSKSSGTSGASGQAEVGTKKSDIENEAGTSNDTIEYKTITLSGNVKLKLIKIEPGSFTNTMINKKITLTREYWLGETEVTQDQYAAIMDGVLNENGDPYRPRPSYFKGDDYPVEGVSWYDAMAFFRELTKRERSGGRLPEGYEYSLPTEAQWEFACHGGRKSNNYEYSGSNHLDEVGWYYENAGKERLDDNVWNREKMDPNGNRTHPVGKKKANELGLYDMSGNVQEWCRDWWIHDWGQDPETLDGMREGALRVIRGGAWYYKANVCRPSLRTGANPTIHVSSIGFRVALVPIDLKLSASSGNANKTETGMKTAEEKNVARKEAEIKARRDAVAAEKAKRIETALQKIAERDFSSARQAFFSRIDHEEPLDKEWRDQWEQALRGAESLWDGLKDSASKLTDTQLNEFSMKSLRHKFLKSNFGEQPWTIVDMTGDTIILRREIDATETEDGKEEIKPVQWARKLQELRFNQIEALADTIFPLKDKSLEESRQALGLYLLLFGMAPAKTIIEKYNLSENWPAITEASDSISPSNYIAIQLACVKERAEIASNAKEPLVRTLATIQAYSLGNALYLTFPNQKDLYATENQQIIKPLFSQK